MNEERNDTVQSVAARVRELTVENERLFRELVATERRFRFLSRSVWRVQEDERRRLARELHDGIGQTLTALKNQLESARQAGRSKETIVESIGLALEMATQALQDTREMSRLLRPSVLDDLGLEPALRWLARSFGERLAVEVDLHLSGLDERIDRELETLAFRVVQEALTNVAKHSGAPRATVEVECSAQRLEIRVSDAGGGFDPRQVLGGGQRDSSVGLRGMRDRAELFGGAVRIESAVGHGTRIELVVPLATVDAEEGP
ncbi:MAG TPA: sensor histidine kinase [Candidatus Polarisedimenticolaceae bacterium]|nr:sensor histidine kinase [Candidatus Polarisedimenticolaceae bacterium]